MRASDIIQGLAELIAVIQRDEQVKQFQEPNNVAQLAVVPTAPVQPAQPPESTKTLMVPPLQQKIELLKRSVDVDNEFNQGFDQIDQEQSAEEHQPDDLEIMKKMAGLNPHVKQEMFNDEPLDD
jgi:hypothetical protein